MKPTIFFIPRLTSHKIKIRLFIMRMEHTSIKLFKMKPSTGTFRYLDTSQESI